MKNIYLKLALVFILLGSMFFISGCFEATYHITVNKDGSGVLNYRIGLNSNVAGLIGSQSGDPIADMKNDAIKNGFEVSNFNENGMIGIIAKKNVNSLENIPIIGQTKDNKTKAPTITVNKGFFNSTYKVNGNIDLSSMKTNPKDELAQISNAMLSQVKINFVLTLPIKPGKNNASTTQDDGRTLVWQMVPGTNNIIQMEATVPNTTNIALVVIGGSLLVIIVIVVIIKSRRKDGSNDVSLAS